MLFNLFDFNQDNGLDNKVSEKMYLSMAPSTTEKERENIPKNTKEENRVTNSINLSELNGKNGFKINGIDEYEDASNDCIGSVSDAGDINGDGIDDVMMGHPCAAPNSTKKAGEIYVIFGKNNIGSSGELKLSDFNGKNGFVIQGKNEYDRTGRYLSSAGDINGDGIDDILIGTPGVNNNDIDDVGESYIIFGNSNVGNNGKLKLSDLNGKNGFVFQGENKNDFLGGSVSSAGDINGDGISDILIGASGVDPNGKKGTGASYVIFGNAEIASSGNLSPSQLNGKNGFAIHGAMEEEFLGSPVSSAGDINGDGFDDMLFGVENANIDDKQYVGKTYILFGNNNIGKSGSLQLSDLNGNNGFVINGIYDGDLSGRSVSNAGDVNGDEIDDFLIGSPFASFIYNDGEKSEILEGESYLIFGKSNLGSSRILELSNLDGKNGFAIKGIDAEDLSGRSVSNAGDVNGDGFNDILISSPGADPNITYITTVSGEKVLDGNGGGEAYLIFGKRNLGNSGSLELSSLNGVDGLILEDFGFKYNFFDNSAGDYLKNISVSNAGDINNDGIDDVIIGVPGISRAADSYILFGNSQMNITTKDSILQNVVPKTNDLINNRSSLLILSTFCLLLVVIKNILK